MIENVLPNISILKMVPVVRRFILISSITISLPLIVVEDPNSYSPDRWVSLIKIHKTCRCAP